MHVQRSVGNVNYLQIKYNQDLVTNSMLTYYSYFCLECIKRNNLGTEYRISMNND